MKQLELDDPARALPVWTVSDLVVAASQTLERQFGDVWVEGELSNVKTHGSGHVYFTLKDAHAQLDAVLWKPNARRLKFRLEDGMCVRCHGRLGIYADRGRFQMVVDRMESRGLGDLQLAFEQLKAQLAAEGLFDVTRKRKLPFLPSGIGVVSSPSGAAVRDFIRVATRRFPVRILLSPAAVQGESAPEEIVRAIGWLDARDDIDVIVLARGGGSIEDLWAFNDERVARAIAATSKPVVSAIGHEVDFTIADFVADHRASTPSAAAEQMVPEFDTLSATVSMLRDRLARACERRLGDARQRIDEALLRNRHAMGVAMARRRERIERFRTRLAAVHPEARLCADRARLDQFRGRLCAAAERAVDGRRARFAAATGQLHALSPLRVLERGYSLVRGPSGTLLTRSREVRTGDLVDVKLREGSLVCRVDRVSDG